MIRILYLLCLLLLAPCSAAAISGGDLSGFIEAKGLGYTGTGSSKEPAAVAWGTAVTTWEQRYDDLQLTISVRAEAISSEQRGALAFDPADRRIERSLLSVREFWLRYRLSPLTDLQIGRFQLGWGKTDGYSPADAFLPRDLTDPFSDEKIPLWAVRLNGQTGTLRYEAVACPVTTPWRLAPLGSRNAPLPGVPKDIRIVEADNQLPSDGFAAVRLLASRGDWDMGVWGRGGVRPAPLLDLQFNQTPTDPLITVKRRYAREEAVGIELSRVVASWVVRSEIAALFSRDRELGDALIGTLSVEKGFGDGTLLVTLAGNARSTPVNGGLLYDRSILPAVITAWNQSESWGGWKLVWTAGLKHDDGIIKGEVAYNLTDTWKATLGGDSPYGSKSSPMGALGAARRVYLALRFSW